jgi:hypothetical protein
MGVSVATERSVSQRVVNFGTTHVGKKVGDGSCWALPFAALQSAGAKTPWDLGSDLYVWGAAIPRLKDAQPGDILQFHNVRIKTVETFPNGAWRSHEFTFGTLHSAIIQTVDGELIFTTLNANVTIKGSRTAKHKVRPMQLNLSPENVTGTIKLYRPIPK